MKAATKARSQPTESTVNSNQDQLKILVMFKRYQEPTANIRSKKELRTKVRKITTRKSGSGNSLNAFKRSEIISVY